MAPARPGVSEPIKSDRRVRPMISLRRPTREAILDYRKSKTTDIPTCTIESATSSAFEHETYRRVIGRDHAAFARARDGLRSWIAHTGSGVDVFPEETELVTGETVAIVTRQLGIWVLAACRIIAVTDQEAEFGFTYATLPDHPECGVESFTIRTDHEKVSFEIEAISKPGIALVQVARPLTSRLQQRASNAYLDSMERWTRAGPRPVVG